MPIRKVVIEVSDDAWAAMPAVARWMDLPSDALTAATASRIFDNLVMNAYVEASLEQASGMARPIRDTNPARELAALLDPDISLPVNVDYQPISAIVANAEEGFSVITKVWPDDPWVKKVQGMTDNQPAWKAALVTTYSVVQGEERKSAGTWELIERTYNLLQKKS